MSNIFFSRDKKGYNRLDKIERIKRRYVTLDEPIIESYVEENGLDTEDLDSPGKNDLLTFLQRELDNGDFDELIDELFSEHGEEGDTFNTKVLQLNSSVDKSELLDTAEEFEENGLTENEERSFTYVLQVRDVVDREEQGVVDIVFQVRGKRENVSPDEIVWTEDGRERSLDEIIDQKARRKADYLVEVRVYPDAEMMAITNSGIDKTLQGEIRSAVQRWG